MSADRILPCPVFVLVNSPATLSHMTLNKVNLRWKLL